MLIPIIHKIKDNQQLFGFIGWEAVGETRAPSSICARDGSIRNNILPHIIRHFNP